MANRANYRKNKKLKKETLSKLDGILKGILIAKTEINELHRLCEKYPNEVPYRYMGAYA